MKYVMFAALSMFSLFAAAAEVPAAATAQSEQYNYSQNLDIAKVISITSSNANQAASSCGPEEAHMVYVDSKGARHDLQYTRMGENCEQG